MREVTLTDDQKQQAWKIVNEEFDACGERIFQAKRNIRQKLVGFGWEELLIDLAVALLTELVKRWLKNRLLRPKEMPSDFLLEAKVFTQS